MTEIDPAEVADHLRRVLAAIDAREIVATDREAAAIEGAITALDTLAAE